MTKRIDLDIDKVFATYIKTGSSTKSGKIFGVNHKVILRILQENNLWDVAQSVIFNKERNIALKISEKYIECESLEDAGKHYGFDNFGKTKRLLTKHNLLTFARNEISNKNIGNKKKCADCGEYKTYESFHTASSLIGCVASTCNDCYIKKYIKILGSHNITIRDLSDLYYNLESLEKVEKRVPISRAIIKGIFEAIGILDNLRNEIRNKDKKCTKCGKVKPISGFYKNHRSRPASICIECTKKAAKKTRKTSKYKKVKKARHKYRMKNDINYKISIRLRARLRNAIKRRDKVGSAVRDLGCSIEELKLYLEMLFYPNPETGEMMTWENYGFCGWHIDHILPLASFDLTKREHFLKACHYTNLQPMWMKENLSKHDKILK